MMPQPIQSGSYVYIQIIMHASLVNSLIHVLQYSFKFMHLVPTQSSQLTSIMPQPTQPDSYVCIQIITPTSPVNPHIYIPEYSLKLLHLVPT